MSGQDAFGLQFGNGLMGRPTAIECDLLRSLIITDRFLEEAYGGLSLSKSPSFFLFIHFVLCQNSIHLRFQQLRLSFSKQKIFEIKV